MQFKHEKARSGKVECRQDIDALNEEIFSILRERTNLALPESSEYCYPVNRLPINVKKIEDVKKLESYIPDTYIEFYQTIFDWATTTVDII
ncbi:unnamed protein product [Pieris brassicae]|uniref:Uncharacterized protein n=1 Tax=Pieris brassicae TaxID=7116 RepID=A0A9P0XCC1_PIEBR|nr:unnamed protein product [Pieris brassicae]